MVELSVAQTAVNSVVQLVASLVDHSVEESVVSKASLSAKNLVEHSADLSEHLLDLQKVDCSVVR